MDIHESTIFQILYKKIPTETPSFPLKIQKMTALLFNRTKSVPDIFYVCSPASTRTRRTIRSTSSAMPIQFSSVSDRGAVSQTVPAVPSPDRSSVRRLRRNHRPGSSSAVCRKHRQAFSDRRFRRSDRARYPSGQFFLPFPVSSAFPFVLSDDPQSYELQSVFLFQLFFDCITVKF